MKTRAAIAWEPNRSLENGLDGPVASKVLVNILDKSRVMGCAVSTGIGAGRNTAKVEPGSSVAVFGLGAAGMAVIRGAKMIAASHIIGIDTDPSAFPLAKSLGAQECIEPKDRDEPIHQIIIAMTGGGVNYSFDCSGNVEARRSALACCHKDWGEFTVIGREGVAEEIATRLFQIARQRSWRGSGVGGERGRSALPGTGHTMAHEQTDTASDLFHAGASVRSIIHFRPHHTLFTSPLFERSLPA